MDWNAIGAIGEIIGALAVVATLGYLAAQIRVSTNTTKANAAHDMLSEWRVTQRDTYLSQPENLELYCRGLSQFNGLTAEEKTRLQLIWSQEALYIVGIIEQHAHGNMTDEQIEPYVAYFSALTRTPGGSEWWELTKNGYDSRLREKLDPRREQEADLPTLLDAFPFFNR